MPKTLAAQLRDHEERVAADTAKRRRLRAELVVLETYDDERRALGHDYGNGQRNKELMRYRRDITALGTRDPGEQIEPTYVELGEAFTGVLLPRAVRALRSAHSLGTKATAGRVIAAVNATRCILELAPVAPAANTAEQEADVVATTAAIGEVLAALPQCGYVRCQWCSETVEADHDCRRGPDNTDAPTSAPRADGPTDWAGR